MQGMVNGAALSVLGEDAWMWRIHQHVTPSEYLVAVHE